MKTPKEFTENLNKKIITEEMLKVALYSVNKRAKNCRDQERAHRGDYRYNTDEKYREKKEEYYRMKELFLSLVNPECIHKEHIVNRVKVRYYDYMFNIKEVPCEKVVHSGGYYDKEMQEYVEFIDVYENEESTNYYLFYDFKDFSFHHPIEEGELKNYEHLSIMEIDELSTSGKDIKDLISVQFIKKLEELIKSKNYTYFDDVNKKSVAL